LKLLSQLLGSCNWFKVHPVYLLLMPWTTLNLSTLRGFLLGIKNFKLLFHQYPHAEERGLATAHPLYPFYGLSQ
ncbi:MAG: hypothetical protein KAT75_00740, partial [Dehalococcoidia bacterium]|nr:hypothetical protein [Dehalococcoidia bacterium]